MRGFAVIGLTRPKHPENVGSVLRAAGCYDARLVVVESTRIQHRADTQKLYRHAPVISTDDVLKHVPYKADIVAVDLVEGAHSLVNFVHPQSAYYIFGPEDNTLKGEILERAKYKVMVPTRFCMNLAACVNVVLYDRMAKGMRK